MGLVKDLLYFGPGLGGARAVSLVAAKARKVMRKRALRAELRRETSSPNLRRLGLAESRTERVEQIRALWAPLVRLGAPSIALQEIRERAGGVRAGKQALFGQDLQVGWPPNWSWRWDETPNETAFSGDIRSTWELQRLQGLLPLAWLAGHVEAGKSEREAAAAAYLDALLEFGRTHPGPDGPAWSSALEIGLRLVALTQGLPLVVTSARWSRAETGVLSLLDRHARWLHADLSLDKVVRGNHLLGELAGLVCAGNLVPSARAAWWGSLDPLELLEQETLTQLHPDGVSVEQSLTYEKFVLEFLAVAGAASAVRTRPFSAPMRDRLVAAVTHLERVTGPDGLLPPVGDCDSGKGGDWGERDPRRTGPALADLSRLLDLDPRSSESPVLCLFPHGGHAVLRDHANGVHLFVRGGVFGWGRPASHSHCDLLAPVLYLEGEPVWTDPGVYGYGVGADLRNTLREWPAHAAITLAEPDPPHPDGTFRWRAIPPPATLEIEPSDGVFTVLGRATRGGQRILCSGTE